MRRIPLGRLSFLVPVSRISLSLPQVGRLSWSHIQGNSGDFPMQSSGFTSIFHLFPLSLTPYPSPLLPAKSVISFLFASMARRLFLLQNRSRGCECGYTQKDARPAAGGQGE